MSSRSWVPADIEEPIRARIREVLTGDLDALWSDLRETLDRHEIRFDRRSLNLNPASNVPGPRVASLLAAGIGSRPSLGYPGAKLETGMEDADRIETTAVGILQRVTGAAFVEHRVASGALANLYAFLATSRPGDTILALPPHAAGHVTHHPPGAAGLRGLRIRYLPYDAERLTVDLDRLERVVARIRPVLIVLGASLCLTRFPIAEVRAVADTVGARVMFDAAHVSGLISSGRYHDPLREGAHLMTSSTYKSFGGPPGAFIATDDEEIAEALDRIAFPGLTANFDLARVAAVAAAALDLLEHGPRYADACLDNAAVLAAALADAGVAVHSPVDGPPTVTHHLAVRAAPYGGGMAASRRLEPSRILTSGIGLPLPPIPGDDNGIRLGTNEVTRWGLRRAEMVVIGEMIGRVWVDGEPAEGLAAETEELRAGFQEPVFVSAR